MNIAGSLFGGWERERRVLSLDSGLAYLLAIVQCWGADVHLDVRVADKLALVPLAILVDVLDVSVGVDPLEAEVVPVDGGCWGRWQCAGHGCEEVLAQGWWRQRGVAQEQCEQTCEQWSVEGRRAIKKSVKAR